MYHSIRTNNYGMNKATPCYLLLLFVRLVEKKKVKRNFEEQKRKWKKKNRYKERKNGESSRTTKIKGNERKMKQ